MMDNQQYYKKVMPDSDGLLILSFDIPLDIHEEILLALIKVLMYLIACVNIK